MGGRISWIAIAVITITAEQSFAEEPELLPTWDHRGDLKTLAPGNEQRPLFQGPKERLELPLSVADQALSGATVKPPMQLWEGMYRGWRYSPAPILLSNDFLKYYPNLVPAAVMTALDAVEATSVPAEGMSIVAAERQTLPAPSPPIPTIPILPTAPTPARPPGIPFKGDVQYFPSPPDGAIIRVKAESETKPAKKPAAQSPSVQPQPPTTVSTAATAPLSKQRRQRRAQWSTALQSPADITLDDETTPLTFGELLKRIHQQHGLPVRIDLAHVLPMASMAEMTTARLTPPRSSNATVRSVTPLALPSIGFIQTYSSQPPTYYSDPVTVPPAAVPMYSPVPQPSSAFVPVSPYAAPPVSAAPYSANKPETPPVVPDGESTPPVSAIQAEIVTESPAGNPAPLTPPMIKEQAATTTEEKTEPHKASRLIQAMLTEMMSTPVDAAVVQQPGATVEDVLRQAFDRSFPLQALINASLSEEFPMLTSLSRATEWELLIQDDGVLLTTKLNANLQKETRVYSVRDLEKTAGLKAEDVARVLTRTVRPWSWKKNFPDAIAAAKPKTETKQSVKTGKPITLPKIDLSFLSLLFSHRSPLPNHIRLASDDTSTLPMTVTSSDESSENVELTEEQLAMLGQAWEGLVSVAVSSIQVIYHADPPTAVVEVLPGILVISQSQGAHREIADLLEQLSQPEN